MVIMSIHTLFDSSSISDLSVGGYGGKESEINRMFPSCVRVNATMYDFKSPDGVRLEVKKQKDLQWFDLYKYHNLSDEDKQIHMVFVNHIDGIIDNVISIRLGDFISLLCQDDDFPAWSAKALELSSEMKMVAPMVQTKAPLRPFKLFEKYIDIFEVLY